MCGCDVEHSAAYHHLEGKHRWSRGPRSVSGASHIQLLQTGGTRREMGVKQFVKYGGKLNGHHSLEGVFPWKPGPGDNGHWEALCMKVAWESARVNERME